MLELGLDLFYELTGVSGRGIAGLYLFEMGRVGGERERVGILSKIARLERNGVCQWSCRDGIDCHAIR
jgi:hypothetical protein